MIEIKYEDGKFLAKGTFSIGIAGVYENKDFDKGNITIDIELDDVLDALQEEKSFEFEPLRPYLKDKGRTALRLQKDLRTIIIRRKRKSRKT